jgi:hypothetical protein
VEEAEVAALSETEIAEVRAVLERRGVDALVLFTAPCRECGTAVGWPPDHGRAWCYDCLLPRLLAALAAERQLVAEMERQRVALGEAHEQTLRAANTLLAAERQRGEGLEREVARLRELFEEYGTHADTCRGGDGSVCACGFAAALAAPAPEGRP